MDDGKIIEKSFEDWYPDAFVIVRASLRAMGANRHVAEESATEALVRALERWETVQSMNSPHGWTIRVAMNVMRRNERRQRIERTLLGGEFLSVASENELTERSTETLVQIRQLPPRQRKAIFLRYWEDRTQSEISQEMNISPGTVAATLNHGRKNLLHELPSKDH